MTIKHVQAKTILRKRKKIDSWFISHYNMNLYRGCTHNCVYCDGRLEGYYVDGEFGEDVVVKINAIDILKKELDPKRKRVPFKKSFFMIGGGVGDSYQPVEKKYKLTKKTLELFYKHKHPISILTKSTLVNRDIDVIKQVNDQSRSIISFSFSSVDDKISNIFEPGVPPPSQRLKSLSMFKKNNIACGMFLLPVIPFITDKSFYIEESFKKAQDLGLDFIIFGGMTLMDGRQKEYFLKKIKEFYPELLPKYNMIYKDDKWGSPTDDYIDLIHSNLYKLSKKYKVPLRIPPYLYRDILNENDLVIVILEQIDYLLKLKNIKSYYGYAAYSISKINEPLSEMKKDLPKIKGINREIEKIILEILDTGKSEYHEKLLFGR